MKSRLLVLSMILIMLRVDSPDVIAADKPKIESFSASTYEVDLYNSDTKIYFEAIFSHPDGIASATTNLHLTNSSNFTISTAMLRTDQPINYANTKATFRGSIEIPRDFKPGVYTYSLDGVYHNLKNGVSISSGVVNGPEIRDLKGAKSGILVRSNGFLNLPYSTINGPTYGSQVGIYYEDFTKYLSVEAPDWKVGENILLKKYFELPIPNIDFLITTLTPMICKVEGDSLKLLTEGICTYSVSTPKTRDYEARTINQTVSVTTAKLKQSFIVESIPNQSSSNLPITILLKNVHSFGLPVNYLVYPKSITPEICSVAGYLLKIYSGGTCLLTYKSDGNSTYLPSEIYTQSILITKQVQSITFSLPMSVDIISKTIKLSAVASSGGPLTFSTANNEICEVSDLTLKLTKPGKCLVTATQAGTAIYDSISSTASMVISDLITPAPRTITCIRGKSVKKINSINPKCPKGYKIRSN